MSDYSSYRLMGFWFQPDPVSMDDADLYYHNHYLEKYWNSDIYSQKSESSTPNIFENYFNFDFSNSMDNYQNTTTPFDGYFNYDYDSVLDNYQNTTTPFDGYFNYDYDSVLDNYQNTTTPFDGYFNYDYEINTDNTSYKLPTDAYFNADYSSYEKVAADDGFSYESVINDYKKKISEAKEKSQNQSEESSSLDYNSYFNSFFN